MMNETLMSFLFALKICDFENDEDGEDCEFETQFNKQFE